MKRKFKTMYICALLLAVLSCGSGGASSSGSSSTPISTPNKPSTPSTPSTPVIKDDDVYYNDAIINRGWGFNYSSSNPDNMVNKPVSNLVKKIPNTAGTPITKQNYHTSAGVPPRWRRPE